MDDHMGARKPPASVSAVGKVLHGIAQSMHSVQELSVAEAALDQIAELLGLAWPVWVSDISYPYYCSHQDKFSRDHGWPDELMELWWSRHAALKMPFYIRCRFEHLPFVAAVNCKLYHRRPVQLSREHQRVNDLLGGLGITSMLTVPIHLPKGQVAMLTWAGNRDVKELNELLGTIMGYLLDVGHNFMRVYRSQIGITKQGTDERARLTPREWDCLRTFAQGYREAEVAQVTGISKATVRFHLDNVVHKFGCKHRIQAIAVVAQLGLLGPVGP